MSLNKSGLPSNVGRSRSHTLQTNKDNDSKNNEIQIVKSGDNKALGQEGLNSFSADIGGKNPVLIEENNSGKLSKSSIISDPLSEACSSNNIMSQGLDKSHSNELLNSSNNQHSLPQNFRILVENFNREGGNKINPEGFIELVSENFSLPKISDQYKSNPPKKSLIASITKAVSPNETESEVSARKKEEEENSIILNHFLGDIENIFVNCCLDTKDKEKEVRAVSVKSINGTSSWNKSEINLAELFFDYYADLILNDPTKYSEHSYRSLEFVTSNIFEEKPGFSLKRHEEMRDVIKLLISSYADNMTGVEIDELCRQNNEMNLKLKKVPELYHYLKESEKSKNEVVIIKEALEKFLDDVGFNIAKMNVKETRVETGGYKNAIRPVMAQYNKCSTKNPAAEKFLHFMALAIYAKSLKMTRWLKYTDLQEFLRQFKARSSV
ncbi:hypothetical protein [Paraburkholderia bonniea]|uniref:hypothetical protein n=1 Tax=Paraburkholderia bonniea TaxID=2152891 RepID=UPI001290D22A|nr:hypothetical protein [Paraburkholderia bonniea]